MSSYIFGVPLKSKVVGDFVWRGRWGTRRFWYRLVNILKVCSKVLVIMVVTTDSPVQRQFQTLNG